MSVFHPSAAVRCRCVQRAPPPRVRRVPAPVPLTHARRGEHLAMSKFRVTPNRRPAARGLVAAAAAAVIVATAVPGGASEAASGAPILGAGTAQAIKGSYIVVLRAGGPARLQSPGATVAKLSARYGGRVTHVYSATITGYAADMSERESSRLAVDTHVDYGDHIL